MLGYVNQMNSNQFLMAILFLQRISLSIQQAPATTSNGEKTKMTAEVMKCLNEHKTDFCEDTTHSSEIVTDCVSALAEHGKNGDSVEVNQPHGDANSKNLYHASCVHSAAVMIFSKSMRKYAEFKNQFQDEILGVPEPSSESDSLGDFEYFSAYCKGKELTEIDSNIPKLAKDLHTKIMLLIEAREKHETHLPEYEEKKVEVHDARDKLLEEVMKAHGDFGSGATGFTVILFEHLATFDLDKLKQSCVISDQVAQEIIQLAIRTQSEIMLNSHRSDVKDKSEILALLKDVSLEKWIEGTGSPELEKNHSID